MSKKTNTVAALETAKTTTTRVKENYRFAGIGSRASIINETDKSLRASLRSGIKSLIINMMSDSDVDLITISFIRQSVDMATANLQDFVDKFTISRNGEFITIGIDNFLNDCSSVLDCTRISLNLFHTNNETFDVDVINKTAVLDSSICSYNMKLYSIWQAFETELY